MQFLRTIHPLPEKEKLVLKGHIRQEFDKAKLRQVYVNMSQDEKNLHAQNTADRPSPDYKNTSRQIDYDAMEKLMKERIQMGNNELKRLKEMVAMSLGAQQSAGATSLASATAAASLGLMETDDVVPIEDPNTQWDYPQKSPYDSD